MLYYEMLTYVQSVMYFFKWRSPVGVELYIMAYMCSIYIYYLRTTNLAFGFDVSSLVQEEGTHGGVAIFGCIV